MDLAYAISYLENYYSILGKEPKKNLIKAFQILEKLLPAFNDKHLDALHEIEMANCSYYPGLSIAAAETLCILHTANPKLKLHYLFDVVYKLASRDRPWEALGAFRRLAISCPKQIDEEKIAYLKLSIKIS